MRYWHDAKGRALFVVTPRRHVRSLGELTPQEIYQLWRGAIQVGRSVGGHWVGFGLGWVWGMAVRHWLVVRMYFPRHRVAAAHV